MIAKLEAHVAQQSRQIEQVRGSCMCGSMECLSLAAARSTRPATRTRGSQGGEGLAATLGMPQPNSSIE